MNTRKASPRWRKWLIENVNISAQSKKGRVNGGVFFCWRSTASWGRFPSRCLRPWWRRCLARSRSCPSWNRASWIDGRRCLGCEFVRFSAASSKYPHGPRPFRSSRRSWNHSGPSFWGFFSLTIRRAQLTDLHPRANLRRFWEGVTVDGWNWSLHSTQGRHWEILKPVRTPWCCGIGSSAWFYVHCRWFPRQWRNEKAFPSQFRCSLGWVSWKGFCYPQVSPAFSGCWEMYLLNLVQEDVVLLQLPQHELVLA